MSERAAIERLRRLLRRRRLMFIEVGERAGQDRVLGTMIDLEVDGEYAGTKNSPEYTALLREIVRLSQPRGKR